MRRQRYIYTLPSSNDSTIPYESESSSMLSSLYSYPESAYSQIVAPEPEPVIPYCFYPYPCFPITVDQFQNMANIYNPPITPNAFNNFTDLSHMNDEFSDMRDFTEEPPEACSAPYGEGCNPEGYIPYEDTYTYENVENIPQGVPDNYPMVTNYGAATILLRHLVRVDISPAKAVYITNPPASCVAAINGIGDRSCVIHPNGRVLQDGEEVHMLTLNRKAKIFKRGIVFTSAEHCLSYLVDASGTKTTAEKFRNLSQDFSLEVFYNDAMAQNNTEECYKMVNESSYKSYWNGDEVWVIGGYRIKQDQRGEVKVTRNGGRCFIRASPTTGQIFVKTFFSEIAIGRYPNNYFSVRKGDKHVSASVKGLNVQNGTQKAGFNSSGRVALF